MEASRDLDSRLTAIEEKQNRILSLLEKREVPSGNTLNLREAAEYVGYSADHFRRLAVEQRMIRFVRPSGQQKGKILFRKADLDHFLGEGGKDEKKQPGRRRKSPTIRFWCPPMDDELKNCTFLKRLSPELQKKIQSITDNPPLPVWPDQTYFLKFNTKLAVLFDAGWTQMQWQQRLHLKTHLAKWLHGFYASHRTPYPMKVVTLQQLCGSDCRRLSDYRGKLRSALAELVTSGILCSWKIDQEDKVHVEKQTEKIDVTL